jgi:hypothetical protein
MWRTAMCGESCHLVVHCPIKNKFNKDKMMVRKNEQAYYVEWDPDASSASDDDKPSKSLVSIAFKKAPLLFSTPHCLMVKTKEWHQDINRWPWGWWRRIYLWCEVLQDVHWPWLDTIPPPRRPHDVIAEPWPWGPKRKIEAPH